MADKVALSRIQHGVSKSAEKPDVETQVFEVGDTVPEEIAKNLPESVAQAGGGDEGVQPEDVTKLPKGHPKRDLIENVEPPDGDQTRISQGDIAIAMIKGRPAEPEAPPEGPLPGQPPPPENPAELPEPETPAKAQPPKKPIVVNPPVKSPAPPVR